MQNHPVAYIFLNIVQVRSFIQVGMFRRLVTSTSSIIKLISNLCSMNMTFEFEGKAQAQSKYEATIVVSRISNLKKKIYIGFNILQIETEFCFL